ncbi:acyltransferase family protein [Streptomyces sp. NPDC021100]|uniref:acyltransferase family protein n=1 Tax=Streptomyces sp. NPDC021100 TaxID=3365114 RepID=UPI00379260C1
MSKPTADDTGAEPVALVYLWPVGRLPGFVLGMILARIPLRSDGRVLRPVGSLPALSPVLGALAAGRALLPSPFHLAAVTVLPLALLPVSVAATDVTDRSPYLRSPVMVRLGELSYAIRLTHFTVLLTVDHYLGRALGIPARTAMALAITLLLSWLLSTFVERPCMRRFATAVKG